MNDDIKITNYNGFYIIEIKKQLSILDYTKVIDEVDKSGVSDMVSGSIFWNSSNQTVNDGNYYITANNNQIFNLLFNDDRLSVDIRTNYDKYCDEKLITIDNDNNFTYWGAKHDKKGNTTYDVKRFTNIVKKDNNITTADFNIELNELIEKFKNNRYFSRIYNFDILRKRVFDNIINNKIGSNYIK